MFHGNEGVKILALPWLSSEEIVIQIHLQFKYNLHCLCKSPYFNISFQLRISENLLLGFKFKLIEIIFKFWKKIMRDLLFLYL
jgi:hypothetical protein